MIDTSTNAEKKTTEWLQSRWRPLMAMLYMAICGCDFILFPIGWTMIQALYHGGITSQWQPLTLQGGGLIHISFGAILGVAAWGRTKEKMAGVAGNDQTLGTVYEPPNSSGFVNVTSSNTTPPNFGNHNTFNTTTPSTLAPPLNPFPEK